MRRIVFVAYVAVLVPACWVLSGCSTGGNLQEVSGTVTYDGDPLPQGVIEFWPAEGQGSKTSTNISNGAYKIPKDKGLQPGTYKVSIICGDGYDGAGDAGVAVPKARPKAVGTPGEERSPPEFFGSTTKQTAEIKEGVANKFDFNVPKRKA